MKIKDLGNGNYQTFPITDDMIEVSDIDAWVREHRPQSFYDIERIGELKRLLADSDYKAIKYSEGELTEEEYAPTKEQRRAWREEINTLEARLGENYVPESNSSRPQIE